MNKWVKRKWVRALRSGEYEQTAGWLILTTEEDKYRHCCLGVLACEMVPEFVRKQRKSDFEPGVDGQTDILPDDLVVMWEMNNSDQDFLSKMNDDGEDFMAIADWIEENL